MFWQVHGADAKSDPKVYDRIVEEIHAGNTPSLWVVLDTHNAHENRFVDVACPIEAPDGYGCGCMCHDGVQKRSQGQGPAKHSKRIS